MTMRSHLCKAFSLIELLMVVSIIATLAALLLPAIGLVRASAKTSVCSSNLRQMGMAMQVYASDNAGLLPVVRFTNNNLPYLPLLVAADFLIDANGSTNDMRNVLRCPGDWRQPSLPQSGSVGGDHSFNSIWSSGGTGLTYLNCSYGFNNTAFSLGPVPGTTVGATIPMPIDKISVRCALFWDAPMAEITDAWGLNIHRSGVNMVFKDGRVAYYDFAPAKPREVWRVLAWNAPHFYSGTTHCLTKTSNPWCANFDTGEPWK